MKTKIKKPAKVTLSFKNSDELDTLICELGALSYNNNLLSTLYDQLYKASKKS